MVTRKASGEGAMTPLIRQYMKIMADGDHDPADAHWFDISNVFATKDRTATEWLKDYRPPFDKNIIVFEGQNTEMVLVLVGDDPTQGIFFTGWLVKDRVLAPKWPLMLYRFDDGGKLQCSRAPNEKEEMSDTNLRICLSVIATFYAVLAVGGVPAYRPTVKKGFISQKRIAKGKPPLYDWTTVVIEPIKPVKSEYKGGTHASPRHHDRRGHLRRTRSGKQVWVRACKVGNPSHGTVFHDYVVRSAA